MMNLKMLHLKETYFFIFFIFIIYLKKKKGLGSRCDSSESHAMPQGVLSHPRAWFLNPSNLWQILQITHIFMHLFGSAYKGPTYDQSNTFTRLIQPIHPQAALTLISHGLKHYSRVDFYHHQFAWCISIKCWRIKLRARFTWFAW